jgi:putative (di)nucleoside polyphosphate hydrolase
MKGKTMMSKKKIITNNNTQKKRNTTYYYDNLPYRKAVGLMILNSKKEVFIAKRKGFSAKNGWQMPQGGIDDGETPEEAALREMKEEIGSNNGVIVAQTNNWHNYDIPRNIVTKLWNGAYRGQTQKWFLINFMGLDSEINLDTHIQEFTKWKWVSYLEMIEKIVPFKKRLYESVLEEFKDYL